MGNRGRELPHCRRAVRMREFGLHLAVSPLALPYFGFRPLALGQGEHETDPLLPAFKGGSPDQHRHATAVLAKILLLIGLDCSRRSQLGTGLLRPIAPFRRRQVRTAYAT